jgi:hypothetical protein
MRAMNKIEIEALMQRLAAAEKRAAEADRTAQLWREQHERTAKQNTELEANVRRMRQFLRDESERAKAYGSHRLSEIFAAVARGDQ